VRRNSWTQRWNPVFPTSPMCWRFGWVGVSSFILIPSLWPELRPLSRKWAAKGVSLVVECGVVRYAHKTCGSSSGQLPFASSSLLFNPFNMTLFVESACLFVSGCLPKVMCYLIFSSSSSSLILLPANCVLLSVTTNWETPNLDKMFFLKNLMTFVVVVWSSASASILLVK